MLGDVLSVAEASHTTNGDVTSSFAHILNHKPRDRQKPVAQPSLLKSGKSDPDFVGNVLSLD